MWGFKLGKKLVAYLLIITAGVLLVRGYLPEVNSIHAQWVEYRDSLGFSSFIIGLALYTLLLAIPFVPGIELALILLLLFGEKWVFFIYFATIIGLTLSFYAGRTLRNKHGIDPSEWSYIKTLFKKLKETPGSTSNSRLGSLVKSPILSLAILLNMPFNTAIGGGGGIAFGCGLASGYSLKSFLAGVSLATLPFPITISLGALELLCKALGLSS